jgi:hypothetical protein
MLQRTELYVCYFVNGKHMKSISWITFKYIQIYFYGLVTGKHVPRGGGLEYLHCSSASRRRRRGGNPMPGGITGPPSRWGI